MPPYFSFFLAFLLVLPVLFSSRLFGLLRFRTCLVRPLHPSTLLFLSNIRSRVLLRTLPFQLLLFCSFFLLPFCLYRAPFAYTVYLSRQGRAAFILTLDGSDGAVYNERCRGASYAAAGSRPWHSPPHGGRPCRRGWFVLYFGLLLPTGFPCFLHVSSMFRPFFSPQVFHWFSTGFPQQIFPFSLLFTCAYMFLFICVRVLYKFNCELNVNKKGFPPLLL